MWIPQPVRFAIQPCIKAGLQTQVAVECPHSYVKRSRPAIGNQSWISAIYCFALYVISTVFFAPKKVRLLAVLVARNFGPLNGRIDALGPKDRPFRPDRPGYQREIRFDVVF